jgi:hypothetical protein
MDTQGDEPDRAAGWIRGGPAINVHAEAGSVKYRILRMTTSEAATTAAFVLLERRDGEWIVRSPDSTAPRIYSQHPLGDSGFLPIDFVFDGRFEPD